MRKDKFLLVSLDDEGSKDLVEVLSNSTSKKIINYLSDREDATETKIAKALDIPLSTVHYNLQKLKKAKLVEVEEFHYSKKGKEVDHYKIANKYVIITPKPVKGIKSKLRGILPVAGVIAGLGVVIELISSFSSASMSFASKAAIMQEAAPLAQEAAAPLMDEAASAALEAAPEAVRQVVEPVSANPHWGIVFIIGGLAALALYALAAYIRSRRQRQK